MAQKRAEKKILRKTEEEAQKYAEKEIRRKIEKETRNKVQNEDILINRLIAA